MDDLRARFATLDALPVPDIWNDVERRLAAGGPTPVGAPLVSVRPEWRVGRAGRNGSQPNPFPRPRTIVLIAAALLSALLIGGAIVVGSGLVRLSSEVPPRDASFDVAPAPTGPDVTPTPDTTSNATASIPWVVTGSMNVGRDGGLTATLLPDGTVLVAGGYAAGGIVDPGPSSAETYDPATGQWTMTGTLPSPHRFSQSATLLQDGTVLVAGGRAYLTPGGGPEQQSSTDLYDPATRTWTKTGSMRYQGYHTASLLSDGSVLALHDNARGEIYDPNKRGWTKIGKVSPGVATVLADGKVLVIGTDPAGTGPASQPPYAELFDPSAGTWTRATSPDRRDCGYKAIRLADGRVLVFCAIDDGGPILPSQVYDPTRGSWTNTGSPLRDFFGPVTLLADGRVFASDIGAGELYDPATGTWTSAGLPTYPRSDGGPQEFRLSGGDGRWFYEIDTATQLPDGRVLMTIGGDAILYSPTDTPR